MFLSTNQTTNKQTNNQTNTLLNFFNQLQVNIFSSPIYISMKVEKLTKQNQIQGQGPGGGGGSGAEEGIKEEPVSEEEVENLLDIS